MKLHLTYGTDKKEGFEERLPDALAAIADESVDEINGHDVLEKVPNLHQFLEHCFRVLRWDSVCNFSSTYFASSEAFSSPLAKRGISELSLNFANKAWREANNYSELDVIANFEILGNFAIEDKVMCRAVEVRTHWTTHYQNVVKRIIFTLTKKKAE
jgi:hypothetical protein